MSLDGVTVRSRQDVAMPTPETAARPSRRAQKIIDRELIKAAKTQRAQIENEIDPDKKFEKPLRWAKRLVLGVTLGMGLVIIAMQVGYYFEIDALKPKYFGVTTPLFLAFPIFSEALTWTYGILGSLLSRMGKGNPAKFLRRMWLYAWMNTFVSVSHNVVTTGDPAAGIVIGIFSIAAPALWHGWVTFTEEADSPLNIAQLKQIMQTRVLHPWISLRAAKIQTLLQTDFGTAWQYALVYSTGEVREKVKEKLQDKLDEIDPPVSGSIVEKPRTKKTVKSERVDLVAPTVPKPQTAAPSAAAKPAPSKVDDAPTEVIEPVTDQVEQADERHQDVTDIPINLGLVQEYGAKAAKCIQLWLTSIEADENNGKGASYREIDRRAGTTAYANSVIKKYIDDKGDPREQNNEDATATG
jgi:hypothetical protein